MKSEDIFYINEGNKDVLALIPESSKYILDLCCGNGSNGRILAESGFIIDGITISESEKLEAQKYVRNIWIHNLEKSLPSHINIEYDVVICSHLLEHVCYPSIMMKDIYKVLKKCCVVCCTHKSVTL